MWDCRDAFPSVFDKVEAVGFTDVNEESVDALNDTQAQALSGSETGYVTVGRDGDSPKSSDESKQAFDV